MMYFESGKFIVDFVEMSEFIIEIAPYAIVGLAGFMIGMIWHAALVAKERKNLTKRNVNYSTSNK